MIAILDDKNLLNGKELDDIKEIDLSFVDTRIAQRFDLILVHIDDKFKVIKSRSFPLSKYIWNKHQTFRILYHTLKANEHQIDLAEAILELVKELDPKAITKLVRDIEREAFEKL